MVDFDINVSILFGLEVNVKTTVNTLVEVFMENSFVLFTKAGVRPCVLQYNFYG